MSSNHTPGRCALEIAADDDRTRYRRLTNTRPRRQAEADAEALWGIGYTVRVRDLDTGRVLCDWEH